jgi:hypothetical protein
MLQKEAAQQCGDQWTNIPDGDCDRDHALYCIRRRRPEDALKFLRQARRKHKDHLERMALLHVVEGRFWYSWKHYAVALQCFIRAMETYEELASCIENGAATESPNQQWRFNSDRWLLKTLVMLYGPRNQWSRTVWDSLQKRMATYGSPDINVRLQLVMKFGRFGNKIDDFIESSVGRAILAQPRLYRFTAACFEKS